MNKVSVWRMMWTSSLVRVRQYGICLSPKCSRETHNELTSIWRKFRSSLQRLVSPVFQTSVSVTWRLEDKVAPYLWLGMDYLQHTQPRTELSKILVASPTSRCYQRATFNKATTSTLAREMFSSMPLFATSQTGSSSTTRMARWALPVKWINQLSMRCWRVLISCTTSLRQRVGRPSVTQWAKTSASECWQRGLAQKTV